MEGPLLKTSLAWDGRIKPAPVLCFLARHKRPADRLSVFEDPDLAVQSKEEGRIVAFPVLGGLHGQRQLFLSLATIRSFVSRASSWVLDSLSSPLVEPVGMWGTASAVIHIPTGFGRAENFDDAGAGVAVMAVTPSRAGVGRLTNLRSNDHCRMASVLRVTQPRSPRPSWCASLESVCAPPPPGSSSR